MKRKPTHSTQITIIIINRDETAPGKVTRNFTITYVFVLHSFRKHAGMEMGLWIAAVQTELRRTRPKVHVLLNNELHDNNKIRTTEFS